MNQSNYANGIPVRILGGILPRGPSIENTNNTRYVQIQSFDPSTSNPISMTAAHTSLSLSLFLVQYQNDLVLYKRPKDKDYKEKTTLLKVGGGGVVSRSNFTNLSCSICSGIQGKGRVFNLFFSVYSKELRLTMLYHKGIENMVIRKWVLCSDSVLLG